MATKAKTHIGLRAWLLLLLMLAAFAAPAQSLGAPQTCAMQNSLGGDDLRPAEAAQVK